MNNDADSFSQDGGNREFWILVFCTVVLFFQPLFLNETFYFRDLHLHFFPQKLRFIDFVRAGQLPLWDPYLHGGQPYLADLNNMALNPTNLLYLVLPPLFAFNLDIVLHVFLCAAGAYLFARSLRISPIAAIVAGGIYAFCGYTLSLANLLNRLAAMPYLPFLLLIFQQFLKSRKTYWFVMAAILGTLQIFAGAPEMTILTWITLFIWVIAQKRTKAFAYFAVLILVISGMSAIQIFPAIEMLRQSSRAAGANYATFSAWSLNPRRLPELFLPGFLGSASAATVRSYWGFRLESMGFPFILSIYFGIIPLICAMLASFRAIWMKLFAIVIAASLLLSLGSYLPEFHWIYDNLHLLASARYPIKVLAITLLPLALLAAAGIDRIFAAEFEQRRKARMLFWITSSILSGIYLVLQFYRPALRSFLNLFFYSETEAAKAGVRHSFAHATAVALLAALLYELWLRKGERWNRYAFAILILADLVWTGFSVNSYAPTDFFRSEPPLVSTVLNDLNGGRLYRAPNAPGLRLHLPEDNKLFLYRWNLEILSGYSGALYSIPVVYHEDFDDLAKQEVNRISDFLLRAPWPKRIPFLNAAGVSLVIAPDPIPSQQVNLLASIKNTSNMPLYLYRLLTFKNLAFVPGRTEFLQSQEDIFRQMNDEQFDPQKTSYLFGSANGVHGCANALLKQAERKATYWKYSAESDCNTYIYFAQPYYGGWTTRIDGVVVPSFQANYAFTASALPKGQHTVERIYQPRSFTFGWIVSLASVALLVLYPLIGMARKPR